MEIKHFSLGDTLEMKKEHPCGNRFFRVARLGSDVRIICETCGRDLTLDRIKLEKNIKKIISRGGNNQ